LLDAEGADQLEEGVDLVLGAAHLEDHGVDADVGDLGPEDVDDLEQLTAVTALGVDLDQDQLAFDDGILGDVADLGHLDQLVELLHRLVGLSAADVDGHGHSRHGLVVGLADRQRGDVHAAAADHARHLVEHPGVVLEEEAEETVPGGHQKPSSTASSTKSGSPAPSGTMGRTLASGSMMNSPMQGPGCSRICCRMPGTSST